MSAKCTKQLIVESITSVLDAQPQAETTKVFKSTVNNLMGYMAELGINNRANLKIHIPKEDVFSPYLRTLGAQVQEGNKLFLVKNRDIVTSTFLEPSTYSDPAELTAILTDAGISNELSTQIVALFGSFASQIDKELKSTNKVYENDLLPLLYGANKAEGKDTTYHLPRPVIFSAAAGLLRWFATDGARTLNSFTDTQIQMIVGVDRNSDILDSTLAAFRNLGHGGALRGEASLSLGRIIFESLNVKSNVKESSSVVDSILTHQLGALALEIGVKMGLIHSDEVNYEVKQDGDIVTKKFAYYYITESLIKTNNIDLNEITNHSKQLDTFFGVKQSFNTPSITPLADISRKVRGSIGLVSPQAHQVINKLKNTEWTTIDAFYLYMIGAETTNVELRNKAVLLRKKLAGVTFINPSDVHRVHVDLEEGIKSKDNQLLDQIKVIKKYHDNNVINSFYLKWKFMSPHRMMIESDLDPMTAKNVARFLVKPAKAESIVVDPAKKDSKAVISFKVAVAQHFDLSVDKTDIQGSLELFNSVMTDLDNKESALFKAIVAIQTMSSNPNEVAEENYLDAMIELHDKYFKTNTALIMAVNALAQYQTALEEDVTFVTDIIVEADAVTSGFGIGLMLFPSSIIVDMKNELNRVGMAFEGQLPYSEQVQNADGLTPDGYLNFANALFDKFETFEAYLDTTDPTIDLKIIEQRFEAFNTIFGPLITNRRNAGKPPFMVLNYEGGSSKVAKELSVSLIDSLFEYIADVQEEYTNSNSVVKEKIRKDLFKIFRAMKSLTKSAKGKSYLPEGLTSGTLKNLLDTNQLQKLTFNTPLYRSSPVKYKDYLITKLTQTLTPAVKVAAAETIVNKEIKADFVKTGELQYFMFRVLFNQKVKEKSGRTEGKLFPSQRAELAKQLIKYYPKVVLKHQDGTESFIDLIKSTSVQHSTKFEIKFNSKPVSSRMLTYSFAPPGVSTLTRTIQGVDAVELQDSISIPNAENSEIALLPLHDAVMQVIGELPNTKAAYNGIFKSLADSAEFDVFKQLSDLATITWEKLEEGQKTLVREAYLKHAYINKDKRKEDKVSFDHILRKVQNTAEEVQKNRAELAKEVETATSEHMYLASPEAIENVDFSAQEAKIKKSLEDNSKDYQHSSNYKLLKDNRELFRILTKRLTGLYPHIKLEERDSLIDKYGEEVLGNAIGTAIQYSRSKGALDTVPHEYAHVYLNLLEHTAVIGKQISTIQSIYKVDRKEAKEILANEMGRIFTDEVLIGLHPRKKTQGIVKRVWTFIKEIFKPLYKSIDQIEAEWVYRDLSTKFIRGVSGDAITNKPKKGMELQKFDTILENNPWGAEVIKTVLTDMLPEAVLVGSLALTPFGNIYRKGVGSLHDIDFAIPYASFSPNRGLKGNIKAFFPNAEEIYELNIGFTSDGKPAKYIRLVIPPPGTKISNLQRFEQDTNGHIISWDVVDENNSSKIVGSYKADTIKDPNAPKWSVRSNIESETTTGVKAVLVDFLTDRDILPPKTIFSSYLGKMVKVSNPKSTFDAKNALTKESIPRSKDVMDFNLFQPNREGITPPNLFGEVTKGSSFLKLMEDSATWHNNAPLTLSAMSIFDSLGKQDIHYDADHAKHLQNILQKLVLEHLSNAEDVVVQTAFIKGITRGGFSEELRKVIVQLNENAPITYAEQSPQEVYVHETLHAVIDHVLKQHPNLHAELNKLHKEAIKHITVNDFLIDGIKSDEAAELKIATQQYEYVYKDSTEFLIYALTNKGLVKRMQDVAPKRPEVLWEGAKFMDKLINLIDFLINKFNQSVRNKKLTTSQYQDFYNLGLKIATINSAHERSLMVLAKNFQLSALVERGIDEVVEVLAKTTIKVGERVFKDTVIGETIGHIKELPEPIRKAVTNKAFLKAYDALSDIEQIEALALLVKDLVVGTGSIEVLDLVLKAKGIIDANRIHRAKSLVKKLRAHTKSTKKIEKDEQIALTKVLFKPDLQALLRSGRFTFNEIFQLIKNPQLLHNKIKEYEMRAGTTTNMFYQQQAEGLASFMIRTESVSGLQALNVHRMYRLHQNLYGLDLDSKVLDVNAKEGIVQELDILVSLMALQLVPASVKQKALRVIEAETSINPDDNLITVMLEQRKLLIDGTLAHNFNNSPHAMIKGYTRNSYNSNVEIASAPLTKRKQMKREGYVFSHELPYIPGVNKIKFGLFVNNYNPEPGRTTGVIPYSGQKAKGTTLFEILSNDPAYQKIDPKTGNMVGDAKLIKPVILQYVEKQKELLVAQVTSGKMGNNTQLIPLINEADEIYDFRVMMTTAMQEKLLDPDMTYENVMSQLSIHYIDKKMSKQIEKDSMDYLVKVMNTEYKGKRDPKFINILDKKYYEKFYLPLPETFKTLIQYNKIQTDSGSVFPIKKEELHILFGAKDLSVRDLPNFDKYPSGVKKSLLRLNTATTATIRIAVTNIIMKMPEVLEDNVVSNTFILLLRGLNPVKAVRLQGQAIKHLREWKNVTAEMMDLYYTYHGSTIKDEKLMLRYQALGNSLKESPIYELMERHMFTSMVEEIHLRESSDYDRKMGVLEEWFGKKGAAPLVTAAKYMYMTKTTAPYQVMQEIFQMSDFLARFALNEHLKTTNMSENKRKRIVNESFVLYDVPGTSRLATFINKTGFTFFYSYWFKMQRAILRTVIDRTNSSLVLLGLQNATNIDVPDIFDSSILTGNFAPPLSNPAEALEHVIKLPGVELVRDIFN